MTTGLCARLAGRFSLYYGTATGNLDDIVKGFGGRIEWNGQNNTTVYDADGKVVSKILNTAQGFVECDKDGRIVRKRGENGGSVQADVAEYAEKMGVPYSYYHDKNGVFHAYAQPEMRDSPIKVTRKEGDVYVEANVEFVGAKANENFPGTNLTYAQIALKGIEDNWNTVQNGQIYNIGGVVEKIDSRGNKMYISADSQDNVRLHLTVNGANNGQTAKPTNTVKINIDDSSIFQDLGFSSHVMTINRDDSAFEKYGKLGYNFIDALRSKEFERAAYNWSIREPGEMTLYTRYNPDPKALKDIPASVANVIKGLTGQGTGYSSQASFANVAAHEFGHLLGIGDAYAAFYRLNAAAPDYMPRTNEYGETVYYDVPIPSGNIKGDKMGGGDPTAVSNTDVALLLNAWRTGQPEFFDKDPAQVANTLNDLQKKARSFAKKFNPFIP